MNLERNDPQELRHADLNQPNADLNRHEGPQEIDAVELGAVASAQPTDAPGAHGAPVETAEERQRREWRERQKKSRAGKAAAAEAKNWHPCSTDVPSDREALEILETRVEDKHVCEVALEQGKLSSDRLGIVPNRDFWRHGLQRHLCNRAAKKLLPLGTGRIFDIGGRVSDDGTKVPLIVLIEAANGTHFVGSSGSDGREQSWESRNFAPTVGMPVRFLIDGSKALYVERILSNDESVSERERIIRDHIAKTQKSVPVPTAAKEAEPKPEVNPQTQHAPQVDLAYIPGLRRGLDRV